MFAMKIGPAWVCAAALATMSLAACGDDGGLTTSGGGGDIGSGGNGSGGKAQGSGGDTSAPTSVSAGAPTASSSNSGANTSTGEGAGQVGSTGNGGEGPGAGGAPGTGGEGPGPGGGGAPGTGGEGPGPAPVSASASASVVVSASSSTGGDVCTVDTFFDDPTCDACALDACCDSIEACLDDTGNCFDFEGFIDPESAFGGPLLECIAADCETECFDTSGVCDSGLSTQNPVLDACIDGFCCEEFGGCFGDGSDPAQVEACNACINNGGGQLCNGYLACVDDNCAGQPVPICDSGLEYNDPVGGQCLSDNCCEEFFFCTDGGLDTDACLACFEGGGGPLCDDADACGVEFGCF